MGVFGGVELDDLVLGAPRLTLRPWRASDAERVHEIMQDRSMHEFLALPDPYTPAAAHKFVTELGDEGRRDGTGFGNAVVETTSGRLVGSAALRLGRKPEIGYWLAPDAQGNGYATEAARVLLDWAFAHQVPRVEVMCDVRNVGSARVALAAGCRYEGTRRGYPLHPLDPAAPDSVADLAWFARLGADPPDPVEAAFAPLPADGLSDGVVLLRAVLPADADGVHALRSDPLDIAVGFTGTAPSAEQIRRRVARAQLDWLVGSVAAMTIVDVGTGRHAGELVLRRSGPPGVGGIGYGVHPDFRGHGYTARALRLLIEWAFAEAPGGGGFARLELGAKASNVASQKAALAAGFEPDGTRTARLRNPDGSYSDEIRFALLNPPAQLNPPA
jgi:RimJ/RimL family protein N-acetyltransferase